MKRAKLATSIIALLLPWVALTSAQESLQGAQPPSSRPSSAPATAQGATDRLVIPNILPEHDNAQCKCTLQQVAKGVLELAVEQPADFVTISIRERGGQKGDASAVTWNVRTKTHLLFPSSGRMNPRTRKIEMRYEEGQVDISGSLFETHHKDETHKALIAEGSIALKYEGTGEDEILYVLTSVVVRPGKESSSDVPWSNIDDRVFLPMEAIAPRTNSQIKVQTGVGDVHRFKGAIEWSNLKINPDPPDGVLTFSFRDKRSYVHVSGKGIVTTADGQVILAKE